MLPFSTVQMNTTKVERAEINLDFASIKMSIDNDYSDSDEAAYWNKRLSGNYKPIESYRTYSKRSKSCFRKKRSNDRLTFKREKKWYGCEDKYMNYEEFMYENEKLTQHNATGNRVFCACCGKTKYLFESQAQADNFIKFNSEMIESKNGYAPIRSYECPICGGWHVTSQEEIVGDHLISFAEKLLIKNEQKNSALKSEVFPETSKEVVPATTINIVSEEEKLKTLVKEIKQKFNESMKYFFDAYRKEDLNECKAILDHQRKLFFAINVDNKEIAKIKKRIEDAQLNIEILERRFSEKEEIKKKMIWSIQQSFKKELDKFNHAFALRKLGDCYDIDIKLSTAICGSNIQLPFIKALKKRLENMEMKLETLENLLSNKVVAIPANANFCTYRAVI